MSQQISAKVSHWGSLRLPRWEENTPSTIKYQQTNGGWLLYSANSLITRGCEWAPEWEESDGSRRVNATKKSPLQRLEGKLQGWKAANEVNFKMTGLQAWCANSEADKIERVLKTAQSHWWLRNQMSASRTSFKPIPAASWRDRGRAVDPPMWLYGRFMLPADPRRWTPGEAGRGALWWFVEHRDNAQGWSEALVWMEWRNSLLLFPRVAVWSHAALFLSLVWAAFNDGGMCPVVDGCCLGLTLPTLLIFCLRGKSC